ncbi:DNA/RNA non-specific endonuclease, partial [candidate division WOR-3 bacterium]|nr:DNA/RNA non-specific endonuclease [candidate division WOR-3 bacterium]
LQAQEVLPQPRTESEVSLEESRQSVEEQLAEENLTEERLRRANDPRFTAVQESREAVNEHADNAPQAFREEEQTLLGEQEGAIATEEADAAREMEQAQEQSQREIDTEQQAAMTEEERQRQEVSNHIESIYTSTQHTVEEKLNGLGEEVTRRFTEGEERAKQRFEEFVADEMTAWKLRRYGERAWIPVVGLLLAAGTWVYDKFRGINEFPEVKQIYENGKNRYIADLDAVIVDIANLVEETLAWCQNEIQNGCNGIQEYLEGLPESLREVGEQTSSRVSERFDELRDNVEERRNSLADQLVESYRQAREALDQRIEEMQAENRGLVNQFMDRLRGVLEAIRNFRDRLMSIIGEAGDVIELILEDPIGFLENLLDALKRGFRQFSSNIWEHLRRGLMGWLFGTLATAGITIPSEFSLRSVIGLILQILGITYDRIRTKVVRIVGERNVAILERVWGYVSTLIREGPIGLWEQIREDLGNLKDVVIEGIKQWVVTRIITAAVTRLVSMFNPAGAIIQAVLAIYNTVMFFIERINQIMELVQGIVRSLGAIVRGQLDAAANRVEQVMGLTIPVIISFLARLIGLGGIAGTISRIIGRVRRRVDRAIDRGLRRIVNRIKRLFRRGRGQREESPEIEATGDYIYETRAGGHTIKIRKDLKVFRFTEPAPVTGDPAQTVRQKALESLVTDAGNPINYSIISNNRAGGSSGYVRGVKDKEGRASLSASGLPGYLPGDHRGHLIGDRFYGSNQPKNLVPMHPTLNLSTFKTYENTLANKYKHHIEAKEAVLLYMNIVPDYPSHDPTDPASFRPTTVTGNSKIVTLKSGASNPTKEEENVDSGPLTNPDVVISEIKINEGDETVLKAARLNDRLITAVLNDLRNGRFSSFDSLQLRLVPVLGDYSYLIGELDAIESKIKF